MVARLCDIVNGFDLRSLYLKLIAPFRLSAESSADDCDSTEGCAMEEAPGREDGSDPVLDGEGNPINVKQASCTDSKLKFYLTDDKGTSKESLIEMHEPLAITGVSKRLNVLVCWPKKPIEQYDTRLLSSLPEIFKSGFFAKRPQESVSLYKCLEAFLTEEPLGPDDMW